MKIFKNLNLLIFIMLLCFQGIVYADFDFVKEKYVPLRKACNELGITDLTYDEKTGTVKVNIPLEIYNAYVEYGRLSSYERALNSNDPSKNDYVEKLSHRILSIPLTIERYDDSINKNDSDNNKPLNIDLFTKEKDFDFGYVFYDSKNIDGNIYIKDSDFGYLFRTKVSYTGDKFELKPLYTNASIELKRFEKEIVPQNEEEVIQLWMRGQQLRSGALQYSALSDELRKKALDNLNNIYWVTGGSSPHAGQMTITKKEALSDIKNQYTITFPSLTSDGVYETVAEIINVEKGIVNGKEGYFISEVITGDDYYTILP